MTGNLYIITAASGVGKTTLVRALLAQEAGIELSVSYTTRQPRPGEREGEVIDYLRERELVTNVYLERRLPIRLDDGHIVEAVTYVVDRAHEQYAGSLHADEAAQRVVGAVGRSGANEDYVLNTLEHLKGLGIRDRWLEEVGARIARLRATP